MGTRFDITELRAVSLKTVLSKQKGLPDLFIYLCTDSASSASTPPTWPPLILPLQLPPPLCFYPSDLAPFHSPPPSPPPPHWRGGGATFLGSKWHSPNGSMPFHRAQKSLAFQGPTPPTCPRNGSARIKYITYGAI
jgi:hypothetical protein